MTVQNAFRDWFVTNVPMNLKWFPAVQSESLMVIRIIASTQLIFLLRSKILEIITTHMKPILSVYVKGTVTVTVVSPPKGD